MRACAGGSLCGARAEGTVGREAQGTKEEYGRLGPAELGPPLAGASCGAAASDPTSSRGWQQRVGSGATCRAWEEVLQQSSDLPFSDLPFSDVVMALRELGHYGGLALANISERGRHAPFMPSGL
eukprot:jgi/Botrbrau1/17895/Bobra.0477s0005.1